MGAAQGFGGHFGEAKIADLSLFDEFCHGADRLNNIQFWVGAMKIVEIDVIDSKAR